MLHFEEVVGLEEHEVDLFEDLVVYVNKALLTGLALLQRHEIARCERVAQVFEYFFQVCRLRVCGGWERHLETIWVQQEVLVVLEALVPLNDLLPVRGHAPALNSVIDIELSLLLL